MTDDLKQRAAKVRLLLMDVDGVLTDGRLYNYVVADGSVVETKGFDSQDGIALQWLHWLGIVTGVISGRVSPATAERCKQTKMRYVYQGYVEKVPIFEEILADSKLTPDQICYVGDDLTDLILMRKVGLSAAPANARPEVKRQAHLVVSAEGGHGAVREVIEVLLKARGDWEKVLNKYEVEGGIGVPMTG